LTLPKNETQFLLWLDNFTEKLPIYASTLRITEDEVRDLRTLKDDAKAKVELTNRSKQTYQSQVQEKNAALDKAEEEVRRMVNDAKSKKVYSSAIGEDLGVIPPERPLPQNTDEAKPEFWAIVLADLIRFDWRKLQYSGVVIHSKRGSEESYTFLDKDTQSPYEDRRKNLIPESAEARYFRMRYLDGDKEIGLWSDEVKVVCII